MAVRPSVTLTCTHRPWVTLAYTRRPRVTLTLAAGGQPLGTLFKNICNTLLAQVLLPPELWFSLRVVGAVIRLAAGSTGKIPAKGDPVLTGIRRPQQRATFFRKGTAGNPDRGGRQQTAEGL